MAWYDDDDSREQTYNEYQEIPKDEENLSHELLAGAAAYEAAKAYEKHVAEKGRPRNHAEAKELLSGFANKFIDKEVETHDLKFIDKKRAKRQAGRQCAEDLYKYGGYN